VGWNKEVEVAAGKYSDALFNYTDGPKNEPISLNEDVVRACRKSLGEAWNFEKNVIPSQPLKSSNTHLVDRKAHQ